MAKRFFKRHFVLNAGTAFTQCVNAPERCMDLARAALLIALEEYPGLDVDIYLARLDAIAEAIRARLQLGASMPEVLRAMNHYLFDELGLAGNVKDYYDPRNSFLNEVLDRGLGIPITLSVIYIEIGKRLQIPLEGVAFPGHFLVKLCLENGAVIVDPFFGGISLSESDLVERIANVFAAPPPSRLDLQQLLKRAGKKEILARMLRNLRGIYLRKNQLPKALSVSNKILAVASHSGADIRDRGLILERLECAQAAAVDYRHYLALEPDARDYQEIRNRMIALERALPCLH